VALREPGLTQKKAACRKVGRAAVSGGVYDVSLFLQDTPPIVDTACGWQPLIQDKADEAGMAKFWVFLLARKRKGWKAH